MKGREVEGEEMDVNVEEVRQYEGEMREPGRRRSRLKKEMRRRSRRERLCCKMTLLYTHRVVRPSSQTE
jgi:hypothetical protein